MRGGQTFSATEDNVNTNIYILSKRKDNHKTNILMKQKLCRCKPITIKSYYCAKVHCSVVQTIWRLTKQENYCGINVWSFIKLTMTWNQNCLKANKHLYNKLSYMEKILFKLKKCSLAYCQWHYEFFLRPSTKIWIANAVCGNEKFADPWCRR
jgi:hypothetical protein